MITPDLPTTQFDEWLLNLASADSEGNKKAPLLLEFPVYTEGGTDGEFEEGGGPNDTLSLLKGHDGSSSDTDIRPAHDLREHGRRDYPDAGGDGE